MLLSVVALGPPLAERDDPEKARAGFRDPDALLGHLRRQPRGGECHAVLRLHGGDVRIRAAVEGQSDLRGTVGCRLRSEVEQVVEAGQLLLDDLRDGRLHRARIRAGVRRADDDLRWSDFGIGFRRQARDRDGAAQHDQDGQHPGEDGAVNEELRHLGP
jgi:hypothetical protein